MPCSDLYYNRLYDNDCYDKRMLGVKRFINERYGILLALRDKSVSVMPLARKAVASGSLRRARIHQPARERDRDGCIFKVSYLLAGLRDGCLGVA